MTRLTPGTTAVLVVDLQDRLLAAVPTAAGVVAAAGLLADAAVLLGVPVHATEQYPQGLGPTAATLAARLLVAPVAKTAFSAAGVFDIPCPTIVLAGAETHVCVLQTALDLLAAGKQVHVCADAVGSRRGVDHDTALRRMERAGAVVTTVEAAVFDWLRDAAHPQFKAVSRLVVARG